MTAGKELTLGNNLRMTTVEAELASIKREISGLIPTVSNEVGFTSGYARGLRDAIAVIGFHEIEAKRSAWRREPHENRKMVDDYGRDD